MRGIRPNEDYLKVIIPVAGRGSRLRPHTFAVPKALLEVGGKPIIGHIVDQVIGWGGSRLTFIVGHLRDKLEEYLRANYSIPLDFRLQEHALGLAHAVLTGLDPDDKEVLVILGDTIIDADLSSVIGSGVTSIGVKAVTDARKFGVVELDGVNVRRLIEKSLTPPSNLAIVGIYYIRDAEILGNAIRDVIQRGVTVKGEYQLTDALQIMLEWGEAIEAFPVERWFDCGKPETLLEANRYILDRSGGSHNDAILLDSQIIEPVLIASGVKIEQAVIGPHVVVGAKSIITKSVISNCIIGNDVQIDRAVITDSLIGNRCRIRGVGNKLNLGASSELEL